MVFTSFIAVIFPLEKSSEVEQRDRHACTRVEVDVYLSRHEQRGAVVHKAASHKTKTLSNFFAIFFWFSLHEKKNV
jgi:hypothetical protein